jgi:hypothetical protein
MSVKHLTLATFLQRVPVTKTELAEDVGMSLTTLNKETKDGIPEGLLVKLAHVAVRHIGPEETKKLTGLEVKRKGRPGTPVDPEALKVLGQVREHYSLASVGTLLSCSPTKIYRMEHQKMGVNDRELKTLRTEAKKLQRIMK